MSHSRALFPGVSLAPIITPIINGLLAIKPLARWAKTRARAMMIERAEAIGVPWRDRVQQLQVRDAASGTASNNHPPFSPEWETDLQTQRNPALTYPHYYCTSFHAYEEGNLGWTPALEMAVAAQAVHARIWPEAGAAGDAQLRQSYHDVLRQHLAVPPQTIADLGCGVGMSTQTLHTTFPQAQLTGIDLSPYYLAVAHYRTSQALDAANRPPIRWHHAAAEATGLPDAGFDLVSACLMFHELPQVAARAVIQEARRLLKPGGHVAIMDMNPQSPVLAQMPPFVLTLLKSTEPYLDQYFALDIAKVLEQAGFQPPIIVENSPRHRTILAAVGPS